MKKEGARIFVGEYRFLTVGPEDVRAYLRRGDVQVVDLREPEEYAKRHLKGALSIPYDTLLAQLDKLDKRKLLFLYCTHGSVSIKAAQQLSEEGFRTATLAGGVFALLAFEESRHEKRMQERLPSFN